ncbi:MAG: shikimate dehydrogenase [Cytophagales bacterium]|nr:MAG: shikimate dehydrogenase [Cytophagales bacterium]
MKQFGLIGKTLSHSFSKKYFTEKFVQLVLKDHVFNLFEIPIIEDFPALWQSKEGLVGMNVTIPYKEQIIPFLDALDDSAQKVGAVNVIKITNNKKLIGYNSDYYGFKTSLEYEISNFKNDIHTALILGTGGASKAVLVALKDLNIDFKIVSREKSKADYTYEELFKCTILPHLIVNCSPLGTFPNIEECPNIPYHLLSEKNMLFDLVYNPAETLFMKNGKSYGAKTQNGLDMLHLQAEKAWEIWNE